MKELGTEFVKIRGARAAGVLLTKDKIFVVYNTGSAKSSRFSLPMRWTCSSASFFTCVRYAKLTAERKTLNQRYLALKDEVKEAEQIRKSVYSILRQEQLEQHPRRTQDMEH